MLNQGGTEEQLIYASILDKSMKVGLTVLCITFIVYISGILKPYIAINDLPKWWGLSLHDYLNASKINTGWSWLGMIGKGDFLNFIGIVFLAGITVICYIAVIPIFLKKKDIVYFILCLLEVIVLVLAASGILMVGQH